MYRSSRFNIKVRDSSGTAFWFNTRTGHQLFLEERELRQLELWIAYPAGFSAALAADVSSLHQAGHSQAPAAGAPTFARMLLQQGFFVPDTCDELQEVLEQMRLERRDDSHLSLTIALTSDCDLACPYCFVTTTRGRGAMTPRVQAALLRWWERQLVGRRTCSLEWLGGEPLLYPDTLRQLAGELLRRARTAGVRVTSHTVLTNGTHLDLEVAQMLRELGITRVQVTLDGPAEVHDRCRPAIGGAGSFERSVRNLRDAAPLVDLVVRMNISSQNRDAYRALLDRLEAEGLASAIQVYPARVYEPGSGGCGTAGHCALTPEAFGQVALEFQLSAMERGFELEPLPMPARGGYCGAYRRTYFVVDVDGHLYRCPDRIGRPDTGAIGSVFDLDRRADLEPHQAYYDALGPTEEKGCFSCRILPLCLGGCPEESRVSGRPLDECSPWRFRIRGRMVIAHEWHMAERTSELDRPTPA